MERIFTIKLILKRGTSLSDFFEQVTEHHHGIQWAAYVGARQNGKPWIGLECLEEVAQRYRLGYIVEIDVEFAVALACEEISVGNERWKFINDSYEVTIKENLSKQLKDHIMQSDVIFIVRVEIKRTVGCRCDTLENFDEPQFFWTDQRLIVEGREFHVNQRFLALKSPIFEKLFTDNSSKEIIIDNSTSDVFEIFLQIVHKKAPSFSVQLIPQIIELANRFEIGQVKEYAEWYIIEHGVYFLRGSHTIEDDIYKEVMTIVFPDYDLDAFLKKKQEIESIWGYMDDPDLRNSLDRDLRTSIQSRSTMEENFRKAEMFVINVEMTVIRTLSVGESGTSDSFIIGGTKEYDFFGLHWTVEVAPQHSKCYLKCDEIYWEQADDYDFHGAPPGWFVTVDVEVFEVIGDKKILVGTEKNGTYARELELVEVDLSSEFDWMSMPSEDAKFEVQVKIVKVAGARHLTLEDFSKEREGWTDACLVVQGRQFHINKMNLARNSEFFADIFNKTPGNVDWQFNLNEEDPDLFEIFLQIAHSGSSFIKKNDIHGLIDLAKRYKSKMVMDASKNSIMYYFKDLRSSEFSDFAMSMEQYDCAAMWEVKVEHDAIDEDFVGHQGLNAMFPNLLRLKKQHQEWPIFIESTSGEVYILKWDPNSTLESLIETVAGIENNAISSQQLMIDGVIVEHEREIMAHFLSPPTEKLPESKNVPSFFKALIDGTTTELSPELRVSFEQFLLDCSHLGTKKRLLLADKHQFDQLLTTCLAEITCLEQMEQILDVYPTLSLPVKLKLYQKVSGFNRSPKFMNTYKPRRYPMFNVEIDLRDDGHSVASIISKIRGLPRCRKDVNDFRFHRRRCTERIGYNESELLFIKSINTDGIQK